MRWHDHIRRRRITEAIQEQDIDDHRRWESRKEAPPYGEENLVRYESYL